MKNSRSSLYCSAAIVATTLVAVPAHAQVEEIIVTAQKREQSAKDVPISLQVMSGQELQDRQISGTEDLADSLPNVFVSKDTVANNIYIRGVGSGANAGFEQAVPTFVDGVFHGRSRFSQSTIVDIDRIEVLRGPQTIYFGNNAIGGAFSVTTRKPNLNNWKGYAQASYEFEGNEPAVEAAVGGPIISDKLGVRIAGRYSHLGGYIENTATGTHDPDVENGFVRLSSILKMSDAWRANVKFSYGKQSSDAALPAQLTHCPPAAPFSAAATFSCAYALATGQETDLDYRRASGGGERGNLETYEYVFNVEKDNLDGPGIVAQASLSKYNFLVGADTDGVPADFFSFNQTEYQNQKTLELRLTSPAESKLEYMLGFYYLESDLSVDTTLNFPFATVLLGGPLAALAPYAPLSGVLTLDQKEKGLSLFGSATYPMTDQLSVTAGLRYTHSRKTGLQTGTNATANDAYGFSTTPLPAALQPVAEFLTGFNDHANNAAVEDDAFLPSVSLQYKAAPDILLYTKYSRGFKAGGLDPIELTGIVDRLTFKPEKVNSYEAGVKSYLFDRTLSLDIALFHSDYKDLQQAVPQVNDTSTSTSIVNVGALKTQGIEAGLLWRPSDRFEFGSDVALLDSKYKDYTTAGCTALQLFLSQQAGQTICTQDNSGKSPPFAPSYSGNARISYNAPIGGSLKLSASAMITFSGPYYLAVDRDPFTRQQAWQKIDVRVGIGNADDRWTLAFVGKNLANTKVVGLATSVVASPGSYFQTIERGRTLAIQARVRFN